MGFLIIDGNSILNRAFYGIRVLTNSRGVATNAVTGFMNTLLMLEKDVNPDMIAVAFDLKAPTFRHKMYDGYKANRKGMPDDLAQQLPYMKKIITANADKRKLKVTVSVGSVTDGFIYLCFHLFRFSLYRKAIRPPRLLFLRRKAPPTF